MLYVCRSLDADAFDEISSLRKTFDVFLHRRSLRSLPRMSCQRLDYFVLGMYAGDTCLCVLVHIRFRFSAEQNSFCSLRISSQVSHLISWHDHLVSPCEAPWQSSGYQIP